MNCETSRRFVDISTTNNEVMTVQVPAVLGDIPVPAADGLRDLVHARDGGLQEARRALHSQEHRDHGLVVPGAVAFLSHF